MTARQHETFIGPRRPEDQNEPISAHNFIGPTNRPPDNASAQEHPSSSEQNLPNATRYRSTRTNKQRNRRRKPAPRYSYEPCYHGSTTSRKAQTTVLTTCSPHRCPARPGLTNSKHRASHQNIFERPARHCPRKEPSSARIPTPPTVMIGTAGPSCANTISYSLENAEWNGHEYEIRRMQSQLQNMNSRIHQATSSAPEIDQVLREAQNTPFTDRIGHAPVHHPGKLKIPPTKETPIQDSWKADRSTAITTHHRFLKAILYVHPKRSLLCRPVGTQPRAKGLPAKIHRQVQRRSLAPHGNRHQSLPALKNGLWYESAFRDDLILNNPRWKMPYAEPTSSSPWKKKRLPWQNATPPLKRRHPRRNQRKSTTNQGSITTGATGKTRPNAGPRTATSKPSQLDRSWSERPQWNKYVRPADPRSAQGEGSSQSYCDLPQAPWPRYSAMPTLAGVPPRQIHQRGDIGIRSSLFSKEPESSASERPRRSVGTPDQEIPARRTQSRQRKRRSTETEPRGNERLPVATIPAEAKDQYDHGRFADLQRLGALDKGLWKEDVHGSTVEAGRRCRTRRGKHHLLEGLGRQRSPHLA
ncbi:unnamed protein product [Microthlaspi erraticum]|uniref:Uncharacterized protein n=1 Tax=Microthlaspi erraticum TaxID=1685480 RepID=A0A6D2IEC0_9BRAS|nr:unnamed protein product [Microthlaspi erraticum]